MSHREPEIAFTSKFSKRFLEIARWADEGRDQLYGHGLARLEADILDHISLLLEDRDRELKEKIENMVTYDGLERNMQERVLALFDTNPTNNE